MAYRLPEPRIARSIVFSTIWSPALWLVVGTALCFAFGLHFIWVFAAMVEGAVGGGAAHWMASLSFVPSADKKKTPPFITKFIWAFCVWIPLSICLYGLIPSSYHGSDDDEVSSTRIPPTLKDRHGYYRLPFGASIEFVTSPPVNPLGSVNREDVIKLLKKTALDEGWQDIQRYPTNPPEIHIQKFFRQGDYVQVFRLPTSDMRYKVTLSLNNKIGMPIRNPVQVEVHMVEVNNISQRTFPWKGSEFTLNSKDVPPTGALLAFAMPVDAVVHASLE